MKAEHKRSIILTLIWPRGLILAGVVYVERLLFPRLTAFPYRFLSSIHWPWAFLAIFSACFFLVAGKLLTGFPKTKISPALRLYLAGLHLTFLGVLAGAGPSLQSWRAGSLAGFLLIAAYLSLTFSILGPTTVYRLAPAAGVSFGLSLWFYYSALFLKWWYELSGATVWANQLMGFLSRTVAIVVSRWLALLGYTAALDFNTYPYESIITVRSLPIRISLACSGVESIALFTLFFLLVVILQRKRINPGKTMVAFWVGLSGQFLLNCLRVLAAILIGLRFGTEALFNVFHDNISWILFIAYFFVFWSIAFPRIRKN